MQNGLDKLFRPRSVAVFGASRDPQKLGHGVLRNLLEYRYPGSIYPINPHAGEILGLRCYPNLDEVPGDVDLAIVVVPARYVIDVIESCGKHGVPAAIVVSGGFREIGPEGAKREAKLRETVKRYGIRLIGPNCIGLIDTHTPINTTFVSGMPDRGAIGFLSQSGAVCAAIIDWARGAGVGISRLVSLGNQADVTETELLPVLASDPETLVITSYVEGVSDGRAFVRAAERVARQKPILVLKGGRGEGGAKAVASHTGALAGREEAYDAAFRRAGILRASTTEELFDWARALAWQPLPQGNRVAVLTNAGGPGILAVDMLEAAGMTLAPLTEETREFLRKRTFPAASVRNPVDILAGSGPGTYALALDALLNDPTVDAVCVIQAPQDWFTPVSLAEVIGEVAANRRKPVLASLMGLASTSEATAILHRRHVPNYAFPERLGSTLGAMWARRQWLEAQKLPSEPPSKLDKATRERVSRILANAGDDGWLPPDKAQELVGLAGVDVPPSAMARTVDEAVSFADEIGYPVALKIVAAGVSHKTDVGGVALNLRDEAELRQAAEEMLSLTDEVEGLLVQKMLVRGVELIVGTVQDAQFGALVMVGSGGTAVELTRDVAFELAPLTRPQAEAMLGRTQANVLLAGFRGAPPADRESVIEAIVRLAALADAFPEISEMEINPLIAMRGNGGAMAVDVRVRLSGR